MDDLQFSKKMISITLYKMFEARCQGNSLKCRMLSQNLDEYSKMFISDKKSLNHIAFINFFNQELNHEYEMIKDNLICLMNDNCIEEHNDWLYVLKKITPIKELLNNVLETNGNINNDKFSIEKGIHAVVSLSKLDSTNLINKIYGECDKKDNDYYVFYNSGQSIFALGLKDIDRFNEQYGNVLHISTDIFLKDYLEFIEPIIDNFEYVYMV